MTVFKNPFFYIPLLIFASNQILERCFQLFIPFIHSYLDDLLALPVILGITLQIYRKIHPQGASFSFTVTQILVAVIYVSVVFEFILPQFSRTYTSDIYDVVCYIFGAVYYYFLINPSSNGSKH